MLTAEVKEYKCPIIQCKLVACNNIIFFKLERQVQQNDRCTRQTARSICTRRGERAEDAEVAFVRPIHHLTCGRIMHVQAMLPDHVTLTIWLGGKRHRTLRTSERLLACSEHTYTLPQTDRQTNRQTDRTKNITSFFGGGNEIYYAYSGYFNCKLEVTVAMITIKFNILLDLKYVKCSYSISVTTLLQSF